MTLNKPVKNSLSLGDQGDIEDVLDEHRTLLEDAKKKSAILAQTVDAVQCLLVLQGNVINQNGESAKKCVSMILHRVRMLEEFLGDIEDLPSDASSGVVVLQSVLKRLEEFRKEVDEEVGVVAENLESTSAKIITKMGEMFSSIPNSSQVSAPSVSHSQGPMNVDTTFLVDGI